jgi:Uma2 family endonuclease
MSATPSIPAAADQPDPGTYRGVVRAVMVPVPESLLAERRRTGADRRDEMWEGVLHMVPPASGPHQRLNAAMCEVFGPLARANGLVPHVEAGVFRAGDDYRVPDQCYARPDQLSERGVEGAVLVVELLSPGDETYDKLDWYATVGVDEVLVVDPETRTPEVFVRRGGRMVLSAAARLQSLGVELEATTGPALRITWDGGSAEV